MSEFVKVTNTSSKNVILGSNNYGVKEIELAKNESAILSVEDAKIYLTDDLFGANGVLVFNGLVNTYKLADITLATNTAELDPALVDANNNEVLAKNVIIYGLNNVTSVTYTINETAGANYGKITFTGTGGTGSGTFKVFVW